MRNFATLALLFAAATIAVPMKSVSNVDTASIEERINAEWNEYSKAKNARARNADTILTKEWDSAGRNDYIEPKKSKTRDVDSVSAGEWSEDSGMDIPKAKE